MLVVKVHFRIRETGGVVPAFTNFQEIATINSCGTGLGVERRVWTVEENLGF